jgi:hypothetical protein
MSVGSNLRRWFLPVRSAPLSFNEYQSWFNYAGLNYPLLGTTSLGEKQEEPEASFEGYVQAAYKQNGVIFACMMARLLLFTEARFQFRELRSGRPGNLFGGKELAILEQPWTNGTTGDLLARMEQDGSLAGNFYCARQGNTLARMRPDWVTIILGSNEDPDTPGWELDAEVIAYAYTPGGSRGRKEPKVLLPERVCHYAPIPDPVRRYVGMSWLTPVIQELMADQAATTHKRMYFENGATVNLVVSKPQDMKKEQFEQWIAMMKSQTEGLEHAYKTLYLTGGSTATAIGSDMKQNDFKVTQGAGETRIAAAARVPPVIVGLSEGLQGSSLNEGNYAMARRHFADGTMRPLWRQAAGALSTLINIPKAAELWYDDRDIPFLQEDVRDAADIQFVTAQTIEVLIRSGFDPEAAVMAATAGDLGRLKGTHTGLVSVQLQDPEDAPPEDASPNGKSATPVPSK